MRIEGEGYTLYQGDCLDVLPGLAAGSVDAVVTDPPYGLGKRMNSGSSGEWSGLWTAAPKWDEKTADGVTSLTKFPFCIIWGGNFYPLPPARGWLIWDKMQEHSSGHAEMAWTNLDQPVRTYRLSRVEAYSSMNKCHPTQKPIDLMKWCLSFLPANSTIIDPFMGSGTTGVAALQTGRRFVGVELDPGYFAIAHRRIEDAARAAAGLPKQLNGTPADLEGLPLLAAMEGL